MKSIQSKEKLLEQLQALKLFPNNKHVKELRKQIKTKLAKINIKPKVKTKKDSRSGKLRRYHNYIRQIRNNFPNLTYSQIRSELTQRRKGKQVSISDAIWQNPSP